MNEALALVPLLLLAGMEAQEALRSGDVPLAVILLGDVRNKAMDARNTLPQGESR